MITEQFQIQAEGSLPYARLHTFLWEVHPIGNGSLGAMIWGTTTEELIGLNLDTLWSGVKRDTYPLFWICKKTGRKSGIYPVQI